MVVYFKHITVGFKFMKKIYKIGVLKIRMKKSKKLPVDNNKILC